MHTELIIYSIHLLHTFLHNEYYSIISINIEFTNETNTLRKYVFVLRF